MIQRRPVVAYFVLTFAISWTGALCVAAPYLLRHQPLPKMTGILMFPVMLLGPSVAGIILTRMVDGKAGLRELFSRMFRARLPLRWYATLVIPPVLVLGILLVLQALVSPVYSPNFFLLGIVFGVPAGLLEEIGWMGFAFPKICSRHGIFASSVLLGSLWSLWHWPVIDYLGTATPHGSYRLPFFLVFAGVMTAMRVLIAWLYQNTGSLLLAQLMHISSTGSLVLFSPPAVTARQEVIWYLFYGALLWAVVALKQK